MAFKAPKRVCPYHPNENTHIYQARCERCNRYLWPDGPRVQAEIVAVNERRRARAQA